LCSKRAVLGFFFIFDLPYFSPSFLASMEMFEKKRHKNYQLWCPNICSERTYFASPTAKPIGP
jgi:hypothetical protein